MSGWKLKPAAYVVQIVYEDDAGREIVLATANKPVVARRLLRHLERKYGDTPPARLMPANGKSRP